MAFREFKDRIWRGYDWSIRQVSRLPRPVARAAFEGFGAIMWMIWLVPGNPARRTFRTLSRVTGQGSPTRLFRRFVAGFTLMLYRFERLRQGHREEFGTLLRIPEKTRFQGLLSQGSVILMMPHAHGSIAMAEALAQEFPLLMVVRTAKDDGRAAYQMQYYSQMSCDVVDARRTEQVAVTRVIMRALRNGHIVLAAGDLVKPPPDGEFDPNTDLVRVDAFGQPVGALGWPARFAAKAKVPVLPVMIVQSETELTLTLGPTVACGDMKEMTQAWMDGMIDLICEAPADWTFVFDKRWRQLLENASSEQDPPSDRKAGDQRRKRPA